jgi:hypothetical protein
MKCSRSQPVTRDQGPETFALGSLLLVLPETRDARRETIYINQNYRET